MLFQPTYVRPSAQWGLGNGTVDATNDLDVKWQVNGNSPMTAYQITIYDNNAASTQKYTTGKITNNCPFYPVKYDGSTELFSHTIDAATLSSSGITNGNEYKFIITQWWSVSESVTQSSASVFYTRTNPTVAITAIPTPVTQRAYSFTATYTQAQGDALNWARWEIKDAEDNILLDTHNIYGTAQLQCDYDGFFTEQTYSVRCTVQSERGIEVSSGWVQFAVQYQTDAWTTGLEVSCLKDKSCVYLNWGAATYIPATIVGTGSLVSDTKGEYYSMGSGDSLTWNTVNGNPMDFEKPYTVVMQGKINNTIGGTIFQINGASGVTFAYDASTYTLSLTDNGTTLCSWQFEPSEFIAVLTPTRFYLKVNHRSFGLVPSENTIISNTLYPADWITIVNAEYTEEITYTQNNITSAMVGDGVSEVSYFGVIKDTISNTVLNEVLGASLLNYAYKPVFGSDVYMLARFTATTGTDAGTLNGGGALIGFAVYRRKGTNTYLQKIAELDANAQELSDYGAGSQQGAYTYYLFPKSASTFASSPVVSDAINPIFWDWTLLDCVENSNGEYVVQNEFTFRNNVSTGSVSNNNEPNVIKNFTQYPTVQPSPHNYQSGTLTSLIGGIEYSPIYGSYRYVDTIELRNAIYNLSTKNDILFLKNRKGDVLQIRISDATEMATNDNSREQIQTMTLHWIEIGDTENKTIIRY